MGLGCTREQERVEAALGELDGSRYSPSVKAGMGDFFKKREKRRQVCNETLKLAGGTLEIIGSVCTFTDGVKCFIHAHRPIACRLYPFYPNLTPEGELELLIDATCPLTALLMNDKAYVSNVISALNKLIPLIDKSYWTMLHQIPPHLWDGTCEEKRVCMLSKGS